MKKYIFYTIDGFTQDTLLNETENCQLLGIGQGNNVENAFDKFLIENEYIKDYSYNRIMAYEIIGEPINL